MCASIYVMNTVNLYDNRKFLLLILFKEWPLHAPYGSLHFGYLISWFLLLSKYEIIIFFLILLKWYKWLDYLMQMLPFDRKINLFVIVKVDEYSVLSLLSD